MIITLEEVAQKDPLWPVSFPQKFLVDGFGQPMLYYGANPSQLYMNSTKGIRGIYDQRDNVGLTGDWTTMYGGGT